MENFVLSSQIFTQFELEDQKEFNVRAILLLSGNKRFENLPQTDLLGLQMQDWVLKSLKNFDVKKVKLGEGEIPTEAIVPHLKDEDFTIVLFSDTPLIKNTTIYDALEYAQTKNLDFCKFPRGFIVKTQNFKAGKVFVSAEPNFLEKEDFFTVFDCASLDYAKQKLKRRIIEKHIKNGIVFDDSTSVYIEETVEIAKGVKIAPYNTIKGQTKIEEGVCLNAHNTIEDCDIKKNSNISFSCLKDVVIKENSNIGPFENLNKNRK